MSGWRKRQIADLILKKERQGKMLEILKVIAVLFFIVFAYGIAGYFDQQDEARKAIGISKEIKIEV
jgi:hypothetical protein